MANCPFCNESINETDEGRYECPACGESFTQCDSCAGGDCGDCTVMYARLNKQQQRRYMDRIRDQEFMSGRPMSESD